MVIADEPKVHVETVNEGNTETHLLNWFGWFWVKYVEIFSLL